MSFAEILYSFQMALEQEYGVRNGIVKIAFEPELFGHVIRSIHQTSGSEYNIPFTSFGEVHVNGIQILVRPRDSF